MVVIDITAKVLDADEELLELVREVSDIVIVVSTAIVAELDGGIMLKTDVTDVAEYVVLSEGSAPR